MPSILRVKLRINKNETPNCKSSITKDIVFLSIYVVVLLVFVNPTSVAHVC